MSLPNLISQSVLSRSVEPRRGGFREILLRCVPTAMTSHPLQAGPGVINTAASRRAVRTRWMPRRRTGEKASNCHRMHRRQRRVEVVNKRSTGSAVPARCFRRSWQRAQHMPQPPTPIPDDFTEGTTALHQSYPIKDFEGALSLHIMHHPSMRGDRSTSGNQ